MVRKRARRPTGKPTGLDVASSVTPSKRRSSKSGASDRFGRKQRRIEDEEIESDFDSDDQDLERTVIAEGAVNNLSPSSSDGAAEASDGEGEQGRPRETVEEQRLRLAKSYLRKVGLDPDAAASLSDDGMQSGESDAEADPSRGSSIAKLQKAAERSAGRTTAHVAESIGSSYPIETACIPVARSIRAHGLAPTCVSLSSDDLRAASGGKDSSVAVWDVETGKKTTEFRSQFYHPHFRQDVSSAPGHVGPVYAVTVADDQGGNIVVSGGEDGLVRIWDARMGKQAEALRGHRGSVTCLSFRTGSSQLFSGSKDRTVKIWDIGQMAYVETLFGHGAEVCGLDSFTKERALSCGRDGTMRLYKILEGSQLVFRRAFTNSIDCAAIVNEQRFVSGGDDGAVALWHITKKRPVHFIANAHGSGTGCDTWISSVAAGRNSDLAASGGGDGYVRLWHCEDKPPALRPVSKIDVGMGFVNGISVSRSLNVLVAVVAKEPRLGRWQKVSRVKSGIRFVSLPTS